MQQNLFADQEPEQKTPEKTYGATVKEKFAREAKYQATKAEMCDLQRRWTNSRAGRAAERERAAAERDDRLAAEPLTVVFVSCVSRKTAAAAQARDLYISDWFKKARVFAERNGDRWFILSALHGLIAPDKVIEPYNYTLNNQRRQTRRAWAERVANDIRRHIPARSTLIFLAGENYRAELLPLLSDSYTLKVPMLGLGIGEQLAFLKKANES